MNRLVIAGILALTLSFVGCGSGGPPSSKVVGKVTLPDGSPLPGGRIDFFSAESGQVSSTIKGDGSYEANAVPRGDLKVAINNKHLEGIKPPPSGLPAMPGSDQKYVEIDAKYRDPKTSGLSTKVTDATTTYDVKLE